MLFDFLIILFLRLFSTSFNSSATRIIVNDLVVILTRGPNARATTVQARHITLYGIEKSGVGKFTKRASVYNCNKTIESSFIFCTILIDEFAVLLANTFLSNIFGSLSEL